MKKDKTAARLPAGKALGKVPKKSPNDMDHDMTVIPDIFYGGKDPDVYHPETPKMTPVKPNAPAKPAAPTPAKPVEASATAPPIVKKAMPLPPGTKIQAKQITKPLNPKAESGHHIGLLVILIILLLAIISGGVWYYISASKQQAVETTIPTPPPLPPAPVVPEPLSPVVLPPEPLAPTNTPSLRPQPLTFPPLTLADTVDIDADSLTDQEEELFGTDPGVWDTDSDGYYDGQEVFNLYNPSGFAPIRIIDSGLVREYINPTWGYRIYHPGTWQAAAVDENADQVIFSSITGDFVEIHAFEKDRTISFPAWFAREAVDQQFTDLVQFENRFEESGMRRVDHLVAYFVTDQAVYVVVYQPSDSSAGTPFRHVMQMMYQSFRPLLVVDRFLEEQTVLPPAPDFSSDTRTTDESQSEVDVTATTTDSSADTGTDEI